MAALPPKAEARGSPRGAPAARGFAQGASASAELSPTPRGDVAGAPDVGTAPGDAVGGGGAGSGTASGASISTSTSDDPVSGAIDGDRFRAAHASPTVRRFARELGIDLARVVGSGPKARILKEDVERFVREGLVGGPGGAALRRGGGLDLLPWPEIDFAKYGPVELEPLSRIKKISGANLARNWVMIPHVTQFDEADVTELEALRVRLNEEKSGPKLTLLAFVMKVCVAALQRFPQFNASLSGDALVLKRYYHLGFAADTPHGLVVPVVKDADRKGVRALAQEMAELSQKARDGTLGPLELSGGTFSISSLGGIGGTAFTPIINAPEVAILGVSRTVIRPVWDGEKFAPRLMLPLSLSYDHRVVDGATAARFTVFLGQLLADLRRTLL